MSEQIAACRPDSLLHYASFTLVQFYWALMGSTRLKPAWQHEDARSSPSRGWKIKLQGPAALIAVHLSTASMKSRARYCTSKLGHFYSKEQKDVVMIFVQYLCYSRSWFGSIRFLWRRPGRCAGYKRNRWLVPTAVLGWWQFRAMSPLSSGFVYLSAPDKSISRSEEGTSAVSILWFPCKETAAQTEGERKRENAKQMPCGAL